MAEKIVPASSSTNREAVRLVLQAVDRSRRRVAIEIPQYNARFIFTETESRQWVRIFDRTKDCQMIDWQLPIAPVYHVSATVYKTMAEWAFAILQDSRGG